MPSPARPPIKAHRLNESSSSKIVTLLTTIFGYIVLYFRSLLAIDARAAIQTTGGFSGEQTKTSTTGGSTPRGVVKSITRDAQFFKEIEYKGLTVADFYATWCGPCKTLAPYLDNMAKSNPRVNFVKVDVDAMTNLSSKYSISAMPTIKFFKNGREIDTVRGADFGAISSLVSRHG